MQLGRKTVTLSKRPGSLPYSDKFVIQHRVPEVGLQNGGDISQ